jgi:hypothetical protein
MLFSILKWSIISLALIFLVHHLYTFLMNTLTVPRIKDLVNKPKEQYKDLYQTMQGASVSNGATSNGASIKAQINDEKNMTDELSSFLNDLKTTNNTNENASANIGSANIDSANISSADQFSGTGFSTF